MAGTGFCLFDAPGGMLAVEWPPDVSGVGATPAGPVLPPLRISGAAGVLFSTPLLAVPASDRPLEVLPEPTAAGLLPGLDSLRLSQPAVLRRAAATAMQSHGMRPWRPGAAWACNGWLFIKLLMSISCSIHCPSFGLLRSPVKAALFSSSAGSGEGKFRLSSAGTTFFPDGSIEGGFTGVSSPSKSLWITGVAPVLAKTGESEAFMKVSLSF